jgi:hypothetical protein
VKEQIKIVEGTIHRNNQALDSAKSHIITKMNSLKLNKPVKSQDESRQIQGQGRRLLLVTDHVNEMYT